MNNWSTLSNYQWDESHFIDANRSGLLINFEQSIENAENDAR